MTEQNAPEIPPIAAELRRRLGERSLRALAVELGYDAGPGSALLSRVLREQDGTVSPARLEDLRQRLGLAETNEPPATARVAHAGEATLLPRWLVIATANLRRLALRSETRR